MILKEKSILVTGASSGIGKQVCIQIAREGAAVCLLARNHERLDETLGLLEGTGHRTFICDLTEDGEIETLANEIPCVDGIVFCAGVNEFVPVKFIKQEKINRIFQTNFFSQLILLQKLLKKKKVNRNASLVFISSVSSLMGVPGTIIYSSSKGAMNSAVRVLASELAGQKIRANAICPGIIRTPMIAGSNISEKQFLEQEKLYPLGLGTPTDVADAVIFHLSDKSRWLTGNIMVLDGGFSLQ